MNRVPSMKLPLIWVCYILCMTLATIPWRFFGFAHEPSPVDFRRLFIVIIGFWIAHRYYKKRSLPWKSNELEFAANLLLHSTCILAAISAILQTYAFRFPLYDVGIFHQVIASIVREGSFFTSISGSGDHLQDHFSPILAFFAPLFWITDGAAWTLPLIHVLLMWLSGLAWLRLVRKLSPHETSGTFALAVSLFFCTFDSMWLNVWWGFHETAIAFAAWSWFFTLRFTWSHSLRRSILLTILLIIGACTKETAIVEAAGLCIISCYFDLHKNQKWTAGWWIFVASALLVVLLKFESMPKPADKNYFVRYYGYLGDNIKEVVLNLLANPLKPLEVIGIKELGTFGWQLLFPWFGLPLVALFHPRMRSEKFWLWVLAFLPSAGLLALSTASELREPKFHYVISLWPVMAALSWYVVTQLKSKKILWAWIFMTMLYQGKDVWQNTRLALNDIVEYGFNQNVFNGMPLETKISSDQRGGAWVANYPFVTRWPSLEFYNHKCPKIVIIHDEHPIDFSHPCLEKTNILQTERFKPWTRLTLNETTMPY